MAYDNNINPGNPPLVWSRIKEAFDKVNENFTIIGANLARERELDIAHIESGTAESNPVRIVTTEVHDLVDNQQVFIFNTGVTQLDNNEYYVRYESDTEVLLYSDEDLTTGVDGTTYDAYSSGGGKIQGFSEYAGIDFENLNSNVSPNSVATLNLGSITKPWKAVYAGEHSAVPGNENNGLWLGSAQIKGSGGVVDLPFGSTINGDLIIDPEKRYFRYINLDDGDTVEADHTNDTLSFYAGTGMQLVAGSDADSITFINDGVTELNSGSGISVSATTGSITVTNNGVLSVANGTVLPAIATGRAAGTGIITSGSTGTLTLTNTGVIEVQAGFGITVSADPVTGIATVSNSAPAVNTFQKFFVSGTDPIVDAIQADNTSDTLTMVEGYGIILTTTPATDTLTITLDQNIDITGSVFADDSTVMVNAIDNTLHAANGIFGNLTGNITGDVTGDVTGNVTGNLIGNTTGYHTGDVKGSVFGDDSTKIVDAVENKVYADELWGTLRGQTWTAAYDSYLTITNGGSTGPGPIQIVASANLDLSAGAGYTINANKNIVASGGVTGNTTGYHTGDVTGSVFADDSTLLVDAVAGKIVGPIESESIRGNLLGSVFADDSTMIVNGVDGSLAYYPTTASDWNGTPPTTVGEALDRIAAKLKLDSGTGA